MLLRRWVTTHSAAFGWIGGSVLDHHRFRITFVAWPWRRAGRIHAVFATDTFTYCRASNFGLNQFKNMVNLISRRKNCFWKITDVPHNIHNSFSNSRNAYNGILYCGAEVQVPIQLRFWVWTRADCDLNTIWWPANGVLRVPNCWRNTHNCSRDKTHRWQNNRSNWNVYIHGISINLDELFEI